MNNELEYVKCVICESNNYDIIYKSSNLNLVLCKNCSLGYLNPRWTKKQYDNYYKTHYDEEYRPDLLNKDNNLDIKNLNVITERFKKNNQIHTNSKLILDIGSGGGENLLAFKNLYPQLECYAIEPSLSSREVLKHRNINIISDDVDSDWHLEYKTKFDIIIMRHVLEHFLNPLDVLKKVYNTLSDDGVLYIAVPNNLLEIRNNGWLRIAHTYYFNQYTLTAILNKASLKIKTIGLKDEFNKFEVFAFVEKNTNSIDSSFMINKNLIKTQKNTFRKVLNYQNYLARLNVFFKKSLTNSKKIVKRLIKKTKNSIKKGVESGNKVSNILPQIKEAVTKKGDKVLSHVSAFNYGNAGDILLPIALQDTWKYVDSEISWENQPVYPTIDMDLVKKINKSKGLIIGGGGLFLRDTNANKISGWQWPCSVEMLSNIKVPIIFYAVGYNRFRGQEDFEPFFKENIKAFAEKSVFIGLRNTGSIESIKQYLPIALHDKLRFQPCMTTFLSELYKNEFDFEEKQDFIAFNAAFDRSHLRFGENIGQILSDTAIVLKELSEEIPIKFYSHMSTDEAILPFLQSYGVKYELVRLNNLHPKKIIEAYAKPKLVIGMRGHAQMIPFGCKTPIISIISHNKMQWFLDDIGKSEWGVDVLSKTYRQDLKFKALESLKNTQINIEFIEMKQKEFFDISINNVLNGMQVINN